MYLPFIDRVHFRTAEHNVSARVFPLCAPSRADAPSPRQLEAMRRAIEREFEALEVEVAEAQHAEAVKSGESVAIVAARRRATHRNALAKLRPPPPHAPSAATLMAAGAACGAAACVLANVLALLQQAHAQPAAADHVAALLPVLRGPLLMLAHFALCVPPVCAALLCLVLTALPSPQIWRGGGGVVARAYQLCFHLRRRARHRDALR